MKKVMRMDEQAFLELPAEEQSDIFQTVAPQLGRSAAVLEKDVWVCWALKALFSMPGAHPMAFKGGPNTGSGSGSFDGFRLTFSTCQPPFQGADHGESDLPHRLRRHPAGLAH